jgi:hypothetical protein
MMGSNEDVWRMRTIRAHIRKKRVFPEGSYPAAKPSMPIHDCARSCRFFL